MELKEVVVKTSWKPLHDHNGTPDTLIIYKSAQNFKKIPKVASNYGEIGRLTICCHGF